MMKARASALWVTLTIMIPFQIILGDEDCFYTFDSLTVREGNFSSPNWPELYPLDKKCSYVFHARPFQTLRIKFTHFSLEPEFDKGCLTDYIDISTVTTLNLRRFRGRYCGNMSPGESVFFYPKTEIVFRSNNVVNDQGFRAEFEFIDEKEVIPPSMLQATTNCYQELTGDGGLIGSPNYPDQYPRESLCYWHIRVEQDQHIYLNLLQLQLIGDCNKSSLSFHDGYEYSFFESSNLKKYCNDIRSYKGHDEKVYLSSGNRLIVKFRSNLSQNDQLDGLIGFQLAWTAVKLTEKGECTKFECEKSHFCFTSDNSAKCRDMKSFCIDKSLICDGIPNCSERDTSDEDHCTLIPITTNTLATIAGSVLVILVICCWCFRPRRKPSEKLSSLYLHQQHFPKPYVQGSSPKQYIPVPSPPRIFSDPSGTNSQGNYSGHPLSMANRPGQSLPRQLHSRENGEEGEDEDSDYSNIYPHQSMVKSPNPSRSSVIISGPPDGRSHIGNTSCSIHGNESNHYQVPIKLSHVPDSNSPSDQFSPI
ncbi:neuropilin and tolloid-like protein 2 [Brevipalpus obovatus]|uniref:neuropilin and tolloid-like protein 2 n=1 Tax=Brevipalpus obovatus TaxID=246614 RepID=UPI003D9F9864